MTMKRVRTKKPVVETERISNILLGVLMHLRFLDKEKGVVLSEPIETLENIIGHIDHGEILR